MMDEVDLSYRLLPKLANLGSFAELDGTLPLEQLSCGFLQIRLDAPISFELTLTNTGGAVLLLGKARAAGTTECARCLEDAHVELEGEVEGYFVLNPDRTDKEYSGDGFVAVAPDGVIDLAAPILASLIYELPQVVLCREDCAGLCPVCGANRNEQQCSCLDGPSPDSPFAILEQLK
jgi:uncharacterized protein